MKSINKIIGLLLAASMILSVSVFAYGNEPGISVKTTVIKSEIKNQDQVTVAFPVFSGFNGDNELNERIKKIIDDNFELVKESGSERGTYAGNFFKYYIKEDILSLQMETSNFTGGAHGYYFKTGITINTKTGKEYSFDQLFKDEKSSKVIKAKIAEALTKEEDYLLLQPEEFDEAIEKAGFYIDNNNIVVFFNPYEVAAYARGIVTIEFNKKDVNDYVKPEILAALSDTEGQQVVYYNGLPTVFDTTIIEGQDYESLVPLRAVAESLGYTVGWTRADGVSIDGKPVKEAINVNGMSYVPVQYVNENLNGFVVVNNNCAFVYGNSK